MTAGAPWSVKGIDPKAREIAKDHARRSGMTLGAWLNRVILDDETEPDTGPRLVAEVAGGGPEIVRVADAVERLADRVEASETRTGLAISGVEHTVRQALARIEAAERETLAVATRIDGDLAQVTGEHGKLAERLRQMESEAAGPRSSEALRAIEQAVGRTAAHVHEMEARLARAEAMTAPDVTALAEQVLAQAGRRLADAEGHTGDALESLRRSLAALDARLSGLEAEKGAHEDRLEGLARRLSEQVEAARIQFAERLKHTDGARVEQRFAQIAQELESAERRSTQAIQEMGRQVLSIAEAVNRRLQASEERSAQAITEAGGEMARVAEAMEARLGRAETAQADQLARLSDELDRISEKLSDRLLVAERRAADAIEDVGQQVTRVTERMAESQSRAAEDLAETIRESEARTAQLLEETRARLEQRLVETPFAAAALPPPPPPVAAFGPELFSRAEETEDEDDDLDLLEPARVTPAAAFEPTQDFAPIPEPEEDLLGLDQPEPPTSIDLGPELSTREVIEQARAAARAVPPELPPQPARAQVRSWSSGARFGLRPRRGPSSTLQTAILVAGGAAFLSVGAAGVVLMQRQPPAPLTATETAAIEQSPRAAVALAPQPLTEDGEPAAQVAAAPPSDDALSAAFEAGSRELKAGRPGAFAKLKAVAEAGYGPAELYLGKLYETGGAGVKRDLVQARAWTEKAAESGDAAAMHNLALFEFRGDGGRQDLAVAARWFHAAAERGIVDSQYNLGLLYQSGSGVPRDPALAYGWFAVAASGGDAQARANALRLKSTLPRAEQARGEQLIAAYQAQRAAAAEKPVDNAG